MTGASDKAATSRHPVGSYFRVQPLAGVGDIESRLWSDVDAGSYGDDEQAYRSAVLAQYSLYVEMADRISHRRAVANSFFITVNVGIFTLLAGLFEGTSETPRAVLAVATVALVGQCFVWFWTLRSYRQLNSAKWKVVGAMERRLPARAWSDAEWVALGEGKDPARYWPLTKVETAVPLLFGVAYLATFVVIVLVG